MLHNILEETVNSGKRGLENVRRIPAFCECAICAALGGNWVSST